MLDSGADVATAIIGGSAFMTLVAWMIRKSWSQIVGAKTDTHAAVADQAKIAADAAVFSNMQTEMKRLSEEMKELKATHKAERQELEHRIDELEAKIAKLSFRLGHIRRLCLDAYASLTSVKDCNGCRAIDDAIGFIKQILEED